MSRRKQTKPQHVLDDEDTNATNMKDVSHSEARELDQTESITNPVSNGKQSDIAENSKIADHAQNSGESKEASKVMSDEGESPGQEALPQNHQNEAEEGYSPGNLLGDKDALQAAMMPGMPQLNLLRGNPYLPFYPMSLTPGLFDGVSERDRILWRNTCPYCYAVKAGPADLQRHLRKHTGERPFVCQVCNKAFKAKRSLQYHQYVHHGIEQTQSNIGDKYAETRKRKMEGEADSANNSVNPFIKSFYAGLGGPHEASTGGSPFPWLNHGLMWNTLKRTMAPATNGFEMPDENGNKKLLLDANTSHTATDIFENNNNGLKNYDLEQKVNGSHDPEISGLEKHASMEGTSRLILGRDLEDYLRLRECPFCGKVCPQRSDMKRHLMVHTGEKPFTCEACGKGFKAKGSLMYHQKAAHEMPVELSQGLEERYLRARANKEQRQLQHLNASPGLIGTDLDEEEIEVELEELESAGLDQCDTSEISEQRDGENGTSSSGIGSGSSDLTPPSSSEKIGPEQSGQGSGGQGEGHEDDLEEYEDYSLDYPSEFPGLKQSISIKNETVLATRLDGVNRHTGDNVSMYKCHMCGRVFNFLSRLQCHLSMHFDRHLTVYQCALCKANFRFKLQLMNHLRNHGNQRRHYASRSGNPSNPDQDEGGSRSPSASSSTQDDSKSDDPGQPHVERFTNSYGRSERLMSQYNRCYVCRYCNKSFFRLTSLQQHERVHSNYKPCNCADCGRGFSEPKEFVESLYQNGDMEDKSNNILSEFPGSSQQFDTFENEDRGSDLSPSANEMAASNSPLPGFEHSDARLIPIPQSELGPPLDSPLDCSAPKNLREVTPAPENDKDDPIEPGEIRRYPPDMETQSTPAAPPPHPKELANEIREKERLDDDVTVVIPTEAPLENTDSGMDAPCSNVSESASWGENVSDTDSSLSNEVVSPPWKSIMAFNKQLKSKRKGSLPQRMASPPTGEQTTSAIDIRPSPDPGRSSPRSETNCSMNLAKFTCSPLSFSTASVSSVLAAGLLPGAEQLAAAVAAANSAGPIYLPSPVLPPGLLSPQLPMMSTPGGLTTSAALDVLASSSLSSQLTQSLPFGLPQASWTPTPTTSSSNEVFSTTPPSYNRSSALANRTHSRRGRLNVVRTPVRREDACKPTVLPDGRTVYRCTYCNKDFGSYSDINRHMDFHEDIRPYKCKFCDYYARTNSQLKVHMMRHQGIREFHCKLCNYKGVTQSDLNRHMKSQIHMMKAQNECRLCGEGFVSPKNLEKHIMACQGIRRDTRHSGRIHDDV